MKSCFNLVRIKLSRSRGVFFSSHVGLDVKVEAELIFGISSRAHEIMFQLSADQDVEK